MELGVKFVRSPVGSEIIILLSLFLRAAVAWPQIDRELMSWCSLCLATGGKEGRREDTYCLDGNAEGGREEWNGVFVATARARLRHTDGPAADPPRAN